MEFKISFPGNLRAEATEFIPGQVRQVEENSRLPPRPPTRMLFSPRPKPRGRTPSGQVAETSRREDDPQEGSSKDHCDVDVETGSSDLRKLPAVEVEQVVDRQDAGEVEETELEIDRDLGKGSTGSGSGSEDEFSEEEEREEIRETEPVVRRSARVRRPVNRLNLVHKVERKREQGVEESDTPGSEESDSSELEEENDSSWTETPSENESSQEDITSEIPPLTPRPLKGP